MATIPQKRPTKTRNPKKDLKKTLFLTEFCLYVTMILFYIYLYNMNRHCLGKARSHDTNYIIFICTGIFCDNHKNTSTCHGMKIYNILGPSLAWPACRQYVVL